jgi:large subunit ribosomal protein L17
MAMMRNLAASLIEHEVVKTTVEKGKELRRFVEPLITRAKEDSLHNRRQVISELHSKSAASKLFSDLGPRFSETKGGYLRVIKAGFREGDKADICFVELTIRDESKSLDQATESENTAKEESNVLEDALVETAVEETKETKETKEDKPKKAAAKKTETKKDKPKKAAAKKAEIKETKEDKPKKAAAKKAEIKETKEDKPKKAAAKKAKTKPKKEEEKKSWWSRFKI